MTEFNYNYDAICYIQATFETLIVCPLPHGTIFRHYQPSFKWSETDENKLFGYTSYKNGELCFAQAGEFQPFTKTHNLKPESYSSAVDDNYDGMGSAFSNKTKSYIEECLKILNAIGVQDNLSLTLKLGIEGSPDFGCIQRSGDKYAFYARLSKEC